MTVVIIRCDRELDAASERIWTGEEKCSNVFYLDNLESVEIMPVFEKPKTRQ